MTSYGARVSLFVIRVMEKPPQLLILELLLFEFSLLTLRRVFSVIFTWHLTCSLHSCTHSVSCQDTSTFKCICYTFPVILLSSESDRCLCFSITGMPKEKYDPPDPRRMYTIMSSEEAANGKKSYWAELEIVGNVGVLSGGQYVKDKIKMDPVCLVSMNLLNATSGSSLLYAFLVFVLVIPKENVCTNSSKCSNLL